MNSVWDGTKIKLFAARNEIVAFNLVLEAATEDASNVQVQLNALDGPSGQKLTSTAATGDGVFNWVGRNIEIFYVKYLKITGLSLLSYETYDERHIPKRMQRPNTNGTATGNWSNRPDHDKYYPDIAVPMELVNAFTVSSGNNQSVWVDIYVPKDVTEGLFTGTVNIVEKGSLTRQIPVELTVRNFTLPDSPNSKTMVYLGYPDISSRYTGTNYPNANTTAANTLNKVRDRHFMMAHRHKISMIDSGDGTTVAPTDQPRSEWIPRLTGTLFTSANGYDGPGISTSNGVYSIGTYGSWSWKSGTQTDMNNHTNAWESWFQKNAPDVERFLYLIDESTNYAQIEKWANWVHTNPGAGSALKTFATMDATHAVASCPSLDIATSWFVVGDTTSWNNASTTLSTTPGKEMFLYNGKRPASGSFATEDDGIALRELPWGQFKKKVARWFFWESTYYNDYQGGRGQTNVFQTAQTFGGKTTVDANRGTVGWNSSNGDGVLFYPGTDSAFPAESYGVAGPIASLRLKHWRRGIQDVDYISLAQQIDPVRTATVVNSMVPKVLWENGVSDKNDPTWVKTDIGWSINADTWEAARKQLADIIEGK